MSNTPRIFRQCARYLLTMAPDFLTALQAVPERQTTSSPLHSVPADDQGTNRRVTGRGRSRLRPPPARAMLPPAVTARFESPSTRPEVPATTDPAMSYFGTSAAIEAVDDPAFDSCAAILEDDSALLAYLPLVRAHARRYVTPRIEFEDLVQQGFLGLLEAKSRYDGSSSFATYAKYWVHSSIHRYCAANCHAGLAIPERKWNEANEAKRRLGESATRSENDHDLRSLIALTSDALSLNQPVGENLELGDTIQSQEQETFDEWDALHEGIVIRLRKLRERDREIVMRRFGLEDGYTASCAELARSFGLSDSRIHKILAKALTELRANPGSLNPTNNAQ